LPAQEGIGHSIDDIPDVGKVSLVQRDCGYIPGCPQEGGDILHFRGILACPAI